MTGETTAPTPRGPQDLPVASLYSPDLRAFIKRAMVEGDKLPNPADLMPAQRRALIIAPQYREPGQAFHPLPATAADVKLIYDLLVRSRYEPRNIRILCDVWSFNGRAHPTRENILDSLEWLVNGATEGDYRFLHFSGHGHRVETDSSKGKEGRIVRSDTRPKMPGAWDSEHSPDVIQAGRVVEQSIAENELVYYNEAIVTRISEDDDMEEGEEHSESVGKVWDRELNAYLAKLPKGCTVTCIMDCCASGRILNLSRKLQGSGFRGKPTPATTFNPPLIIPSFPSQDNASIPSTPSLTSPAITSIATIASTVVNILPRMTRYARIVMQEGIPVRERDMDEIQARIFAWSACHQRQQSWDSNDCSNGLFTQTFTETCTRLGGPIESPTRYTYHTLFEEVSKLVADMRATSPNPAPQFVQLWTSLKEESKNIETSLLDSHVEF
ncbi:ICE-like protease (caspase) p20 domain protein [Rhizoctonia solani AG-3 Rhs1AP]|uniref:ICE-like protease (Caspase) p20 domain protein n=1 Tax=Rhizoctonia solani AG-3 Rhs1AP TaxID=1086054 RepID=X8JIX6_9AGAM|nr:ICE-like protease (caspase) p20 domain protein [Rhizoctonia solani AG-3 Rhs1AP]